jgi:hypothetical protein
LSKFFNHLVNFFFFFSYYYFYFQQSGDAKNPNLGQDSAVLEDIPVIVSCTVIKNNIKIKIILKPIKENLRIFLIDLNFIILEYRFLCVSYLKK